MNIKKIAILAIIFLLCILTIFIIVATKNYFYIEKQELIQFADLEECKREWLRTQQPLKRHDIYVMSKDEIPQYMKLYNIDVEFVSYTPSYNMYDYNIMNWYLKDPEPGLLGVYFTSRPNPFKSRYPNSDYKYTLNDLLKYELEISDAYVFWDANTKKSNLSIPIIQHIINIYSDQNNNTYKENLIQKDLFDNGITNNKIYVELNCYNFSPKVGLSVPFESDELFFTNHKIEAVYFDGGLRLKNSHIKLSNLIRLGNGAKNIHLYSFNIIDKKRSIVSCEHQSDPYTAIRRWKKSNNLFNDPQVIAKSDYIWEIKDDDFVLTHTVETEDEIMTIKFTSNYKEHLQQWMNQCDIKQNRFYSAQEIRDKFGRYSRTIYDQHGRPINYRYVEGFWYDDWYIDGSECIGPSNYFNSYLDTTQPPKKPIEVNNISNRPIKNESSVFDALTTKVVAPLQNNEQVITVKQPEINDERIVRPASKNFEVKKINKTTNTHIGLKL